ncbi:hypothetical protein GQX74_001452 [Glossina fuscipes]|nr:hypothetical protein GQX74_001452 [Glossina fuscipes]
MDTHCAESSFTYDNINSCLSQLRSHAVAGLDNITTNDICCGRLKAVLALFFALSRYKQQSKQSKCVNNTNGFSIKAEIHQQPQTNTLSVSVGGGVSEKVSNSSATALLVQSMQNGNDTTMTLNSELKENNDEAINTYTKHHSISSQEIVVYVGTIDATIRRLDKFIRIRLTNKE